MTTIAYKDGVIACDSQITAGETIHTMSRNKIRRRKGFVLIACGSEHLVEQVFETWPDVRVDGDEWSAYAVDSDGLWECGSEEGALWKLKVRHDEHSAMGSGGAYALGAMDAGATAVEAVKVAAGRDVATGGRVRKFKVY